MKLLSLPAVALGLAIATGCANQAAFDGSNHYVVESQKDLPRNDAARLAIATARELEYAKLPAEAASQYERARQLDPTQKWITRRLAVMYDRAGRTSLARTEYSEAIKLFPNDASLMNDYGYFHYSRGNYDEAELWFRRALDQDPNLTVAKTNLGMTLCEQGRYPEALRAFEDVVPSAEAHQNVGVIMARQGKYDEARESLEEALRLDPNLAEARQVLDMIDKKQGRTSSPAPASN